MASWPGALPDDFLVAGFSEKVPDTRVRTEMEEGPAFMRRWGTGTTYDIAGQMEMTTAQVATFRTFGVSTLTGWTLPFDWTHPRTGSSVEMRFKTQPSWRPKPGFAGRWLVDMVLEVMP